MHLSDGVIDLSVCGTAGAGAAALLAYSAKGVKQEEIPRISLLTGAFFVVSLIHVPIGPTSAHMLLGGLMGIMLGRRAPIAIFLALLLQTLLFQHGGLTTLGVNMLLVSIPALAAGKIFYILKNVPVFWRGSLAGGVGVIGCLILLIIVLLISEQRYGEGAISVVNVLAATYLPLMLIEAAITGFAVQMLYRTRPELLSGPIDRAV